MRSLFFMLLITMPTIQRAGYTLTRLMALIFSVLKSSYSVILKNQSVKKIHIQIQIRI